MKFAELAGLTRKLNAGFAVIGAGIVVLVLSDLFSEQLGGGFSLFTVVVINLAMAGSFVWLCVSVRCPQCDHAFFWESLTRRGSLIEVYRARSCPNCGLGADKDEFHELRRP